jgi:hypothetical protein
MEIIKIKCSGDNHFYIVKLHFYILKLKDFIPTMWNIFPR